MDNQKLLNIIDNNGLNNKHFSQIYESLCRVCTESKEDILKALQELEESSFLMRDNKNKYATAKSKGYIYGKIIKGNRGDYFCDVDDSSKRILINKFNLKDAFVGDYVCVKSFKKQNTGEVVKVIKRAQEVLLGEVKDMGKYYFVMPLDDKYSSNVMIEKDKSIAVKNGDKVLVKLSNFEHNNLQGNIIEVMSDKKSYDLDMLSIALNNGFNPHFSDATMQYAKNLPQLVSEEEIKGRTDCRKDITFTIDGDDAKDFDDAISLSVNDKGNYVLKVHIADVSNYVKLNSPIYNDAYERATSVYLPGLTLPMLPEELSNGICSLNPNVDRLTLCFETELNKNAEVVDFHMYESVINSAYRMTYNKVNKIFDGDKELCKEYSILLPMLNQMKDLSALLEKRAIARGNLNLSTVEPKFYFDKETHMPEKMENREMGISENLIENFMILTNEQGNKKMTEAKTPFVNRIHGKPSDEKLKEFVSFLEEIGKGDYFRSEKITKKDIQNFLNKTSTEENKEILHNFFLRSMQKARYSSKCDGHYGLGLLNYSHLTSPIRRLPDLISHNIIKLSLKNKLDVSNIANLKGLVEDISEQSTEREIAATKAEREADDVTVAHIMSKHIGETFDGTVCGITKNGLFVSVNKVIEGYVKLEDLNAGEYKDNTKTKLKLSKKTIKLFDNIKVKIASVNKREGWIDFVPANECTCEKTN